MPAQPATTDELQRFLGTIPSPEKIRERIAHNAHEISVLKRVLKLSEVAATAARGANRAS
jgi:hypothetical protein